MLNDKKHWMDCCHLFVQKYVSTQSGGDSEEILMPMVRKYLCYINAAWSLYNFEQTNVNANTTNKSIIEIAREMVVAERYPKVQLLRLGLSVADAFYGHVTQLLDIVPYLSKIVKSAASGISSSSSSSSLEYDSLYVHVEVMKAINVIMFDLLKGNRITDGNGGGGGGGGGGNNNELMLTLDQQSNIYNILDSSSKLLMSNNYTTSTTTSTTTTSNPSMNRDHERSQLEILLDLSTKVVQDYLSEIDAFRRSAESFVGQTYFEKVFANVVPVLLLSGKIETISQVGQHYVHYDTLYEVCHYCYTRDMNHGNQKLQDFMNDPLLTISDKFNKEYPMTFSAYVYNRL